MRSNLRYMKINEIKPPNYSLKSTGGKSWVDSALSYMLKVDEKNEINFSLLKKFCYHPCMN